MGRHTTLRQLRVLLAAVVITATSFAVQGTPVPIPDAVRDVLETPEALAAFCASNPTFTGRLTETASTTTAASRITEGTVYGYISDVASTWSCTAFLRYSGITWNTTTSVGTFDWGNLINSTSVGCNYVVGSTDYIKGNSTSDCPDSDAEYALPVSLPEGVYQNDSDHNGTGDFSYVHADCGTYYGGETIKSGQSFSTSNTGNRPGANCDPITLDGTGIAQIVTYDKTAPILAFSAPGAGTIYRNTTAFTVTITVTEAVAGFGGTNTWKVQRQLAPITSPNVCGTFANDPAAGNLSTGTTTGTINLAQTLAAGSCYRWVANATDQNGNQATQVVSGTVLVDTVAPAADFGTPNEGTTTVLNGTTSTVTWTETDAHSGVASRSLQRQIVTASGATCPTTWANDGSAVTTASPVAVSGLVDGTCYRWIETLTDSAGTTGSATSGTIRVNVGSPSADFSTPDEGTTTYQNTTGYTVAWSETAGSGSITARSLQRQTGTVVTNGTCTGVSYANDGAASTAVSPVGATGLASGSCYRWVQTLTNSVPKTAASTSGQVLVDAALPTASLTAPVANASLAGPVTITGVATDAVSFLDYTLDYGAGGTPASWTTITTATSQVTGTLATWSPGTLSGAYTIRLTVRDKAGNTATASRLVYLENAGRGTESYVTRVPFDLGGGWGLDVGVANGEARLSRDILSIPSYGPSQALSLSYSSAETGATGRFGVGWSSNLTQSLSFESGFVVWHRADGGRVPFGNVGGVWTPLAGHHETLTRGANDTITLKDQTRLVFENTGGGRLLWLENRFGKKLTMSWGTSSATATDASGRAMTLAIDSTNGRITSITDSATRTWTFGYAGSGASSDLTSVTEPDPDGAGPLAAPVTTLGHDGSHRLTTVTRTRSRVTGAPEAIIWTVGYTVGKATSVTDPIAHAAHGGVASTFAYNPSSTEVGLIQAYSPLARNTWTYTLDPLGRATSILDPLGYTTDRIFDDASNETHVYRQINDVSSTWTLNAYDARGNLTTNTMRVGLMGERRTASSYNATNDLLTRSEADNDPSVKTVTRYGYDAAGHLLTVNVNCTSSGTTPPADASTCTGNGTASSSTNLVTTYTYTAHDQVETETDPLGRVTGHVYDAAGNETQVIRNFVPGQSGHGLAQRHHGIRVRRGRDAGHRPCHDRGRSARPRRHPHLRCPRAPDQRGPSG